MAIISRSPEGCRKFLLVSDKTSQCVESTRVIMTTEPLKAVYALGSRNSEVSLFPTEMWSSSRCSYLDLCFFMKSRTVTGSDVVTFGLLCVRIDQLCCLAAAESCDICWHRRTCRSQKRSRWLSRVEVIGRFLCTSGEQQRSPLGTDLWSILMCTVPDGLVLEGLFLIDKSTMRFVPVALYSWQWNHFGSFFARSKSTRPPKRFPFRSPAGTSYSISNGCMCKHTGMVLLKNRTKISLRWWHSSPTDKVRLQVQLRMTKGSPNVWIRWLVRPVKATSLRSAFRYGKRLRHALLDEGLKAVKRQQNRSFWLGCGEIQSSDDPFWTPWIIRFRIGSSFHAVARQNHSSNSISWPSQIDENATG